VTANISQSNRNHDRFMFTLVPEVSALDHTNNIFGNKFIRRPDLTTFDRLQIAYEAFCAKIFGHWGMISALARYHNISRTFIYNTLAVFEEVVELALGEPPQQIEIENKRESVELIIVLRLEGKCGIGAISTIMKRLNHRFSGQGTVSTYLNHIGSLVPSGLMTEDNVRLVFLSDEIFSGNTPILITVDPISSAILKIELVDKRRAEEWSKHWLCLKKNGFEAIYYVTDEGSGLCSAHDNLFSGAMRQPDTFHAVAYRLGGRLERLEESAYKAIAYEYDRKEKILSAKSEDVIRERTQKYEQARDKAEKAMELYDSFSYLYGCILGEMKPFRHDGELRNRQQAEENIQAALEMIESLGHEKINDAVNKIRRVMPTLLNYFDVACEVREGLGDLAIGQNALASLCLAWQHHKAVIKAKKTDRRKKCADREQRCLEFAEGYLQEKFEIIKDRVYNELDTIVQSSAMVECINSIIRPYLNTSRGQVNQNMLNLIAFYHNNRRYRVGKRANKTPMEILTGKKQEKDWTELLFDLVEEKDPQFFSATA
jgi:tetratricopeptide (TPR) repeat protein